MPIISAEFLERAAANPGLVVWSREPQEPEQWEKTDTDIEALLKEILCDVNSCN